MASWSHTFGPTLFVENNFNTSLINWQYSYNQAGSQQNISGQFGTPNPFNQPGAPYINNALYQGVSLNGIVPRTQFTKVFSGEQNYSWNRSNHQIEFGWRYQQEILDTLPDAPRAIHPILRQQCYGALQSLNRHRFRHAGRDRRQRRELLPRRRSIRTSRRAARKTSTCAARTSPATSRTIGRSAATSPSTSVSVGSTLDPTPTQME